MGEGKAFLTWKMSEKHFLIATILTSFTQLERINIIQFDFI